MKKILFILLFLFSVIPCSGYLYSDIEIENNPNIENYQTYTIIDYRDGMNYDFSNIRIYNTMGDEVPYFVESVINATSAKVWYQIDSTDTKMQVRWGIDGETESESNPAAVYDIYDNFNTNRIGTLYTESYGDALGFPTTHTIENGKYVCEIPSYADRGAILTTSLSENLYIYTVNINYINRSGRNPPYTTFRLYSGNAYEYGYWGSVINFNPNSPSDNLTVVWNNGNSNNNIKIYRSGSLISTGSNTFTSSNVGFGFRTGGSEKIKIEYDDFIVRKYAEIEPTSTIGETKNSANITLHNESCINVFQNEIINIKYNGSTPVVWTVDDIVNSYTGSTLEISFEKAGNHYISASHGSDIQNFTVIINRALATTPIEKLNDSDYNKLISNLENDEWSDIGVIITNPFTNIIGKIFYIFVFVLPFIILWKENESMGVPTILAFIFGCLFIGFVPAQFTSLIIIAITVVWTYVLYDIWRKR